MPMAQGRRVLLVIAAVVAVVAVVGLSVTALARRSDRDAAPPAGALAWRPCDGAPDFQCATMKAPLDYDSPQGSLIDIAVIRRPAPDPARRKGAILWNAGGPGGASTSALPSAYASFSPGVRGNFDVVSIDPRGIGQSTPLRCFADPAKEAELLGKAPAGFPVGVAEVRLSESVNKQYGEACARDGGPIQAHMSTANVARDMDRLRELLGEQTVNYYGPSYGTYLGATYLNLYPERVGRVVLDGNVAPQQWNDVKIGTSKNTFLRIESPTGALVALQLFLSECGKVDATRCAFSAGSPEATDQKYRKLLERLRSKPTAIGKIPFSYAQTASLVGSLLSGQNKSGAYPGWRALAALIQTVDAQTRSARPVTVPLEAQEVLDTLGQSSGGPAGTLGVLCGESPNPRDPGSYLDQGRMGDAGTPYGLGQTWTWLAQPCAEWTARDEDRYAGPWNRSTPPVLVIGTRADPNTAYSGSVRMAQQLGNARLLTETGGGHTALFNKSDCVDAYVDNYFLNGALPPEGSMCDQNLAPF